MRKGLAEIARPLLDRVKQFEGRSQMAQGSADGGAAKAEETRRGLLDTRQGLRDTRRHMANLIRSNDPEMTVGLKTLVMRLELKISAVEQEVGGGMVEIGPYKFRSQAEVATFVGRAFLPELEVYD